MTSFDRVYRGEALVFEGRHEDAEGALRSVLDASDNVLLRRMALARLAFLEALRANWSSVRASLDGVAAPQPERSVPFLDAWDDLFVAWAESHSGNFDSARERAAAVEKYFRSKSLRPAASVAQCVRAELFLLEGDVDRALDVIESIPPDHHLTRVAAPILSARLSLEGADSRRSIAKIADLLVLAGAALVGNPLKEWELQLLELRAAIDEIAGSSRSPRAESSRVGTGTQTQPLDGAGSIRAQLVARSPAMRELVRTLDRIRESELPAVIRGETGSGKELVAQAIHAESDRREGPFGVFDCAAIPEALFEVELFGARAGAFTDIDTDRDGILAEADGGTLLVEGIAELERDLQSKFLRAVSEGVVRPVGTSESVSYDVRFLFSTTRDLKEEVEAGRRRADLFHRIQVLSIGVPPLRQRQEDLEELVGLVLAESRDDPPSVAPGVIERLAAIRWPGNVRQLRNVFRRLSIESTRTISLDDLDRVAAETAQASLLPGQLFERQSLEELQGPRRAGLSEVSLAPPRGRRRSAELPARRHASALLPAVEEARDPRQGGAATRGVLRVDGNVAMEGEP